MTLLLLILKGNSHGVACPGHSPNVGIQSGFWKTAQYNRIAYLPRHCRDALPGRLYLKGFSILIHHLHKWLCWLTTFSTTCYTIYSIVSVFIGYILYANLFSRDFINRVSYTRSVHHESHPKGWGNDRMVWTQPTSSLVTSNTELATICRSLTPAFRLGCRRTPTRALALTARNMAFFTPRSYTWAKRCV